MYDVNVPKNLGSQLVTTTVAVVTQPPPSVNVPKPVSYQFQVVEYIDEDKKVVRVELQVQMSEHDNYGNTISSSGFKPVPRIKLPMP